jgi:superfamily II DNA or RNA helicase
MQLRPYQVQLIDQAREALKKDRRVLLVAPTGAGKTAITVYMMRQAAARGLRSCFIVHQNELLMQTSRALWAQKLEHGVIASGKSRSGVPTQVASVQTLINRLSEYDPWNLIIIDEAHRSAARTYKEVCAAYPKAKVIGLTATPQRTDGKGLADMFDSMVQGPTIPQLIEAGYLCDYEIYAPMVDFDISAVKSVAGDYAKGDLEIAMDKPKITGDAVQHYATLANGKRCVVMCVTVKHAQHVAEQYRAAGIPAECMDGTMSTAQRDQLLGDFKSGKTKIITAVQLMIEGVDVPGIEVVQWLRPTQSVIVWMQGNGRGFRPYEGKDKLIILDHVGNVMRHGLPDQKRLWTLEGRTKGKRRQSSDETDLGIQTCPKCRHVFLSGVSACPMCDEPVELKERKIEQVDGNLEKLDRKIEIKEQRREQGKAKSLVELVQLGKRRNMSNPAGWAVNVYAARLGRKPTGEDYAQARSAAA